LPEVGERLSKQNRQSVTTGLLSGFKKEAPASQRCYLREELSLWLLRMLANPNSTASPDKLILKTKRPRNPDHLKTKTIDASNAFR
jgi:hypothetical protein